MLKTCTDCQKQFELTEQETDFLEKIAPVFNGKKYKIPVPEICPNCRLAQRTMQRNEQYLYHNKSAISGKDLISIYSPDTQWGKNLKIYSHEEWWSDKWDPMKYGKDFDFGPQLKPFFEQFQELHRQIPLVNLVTVSNENSPYTTGTGYCKNCYLLNCSEYAEDCYYGKLIQSSRDIMDSSYVYDSELCYQCFYIKNCFNCNYVYYSQNSSDCWFSDNLKGCRNCFLCTNLVNKEYHFMNERLSKEEYQAKIKEYLNTAAGIQKAKEQLSEIRKTRIYKYTNEVNCENSSGDFLTNCKNCTDCYDLSDSEDCKYVTVGVECKDLLDCSNMYIKPELNYQVLGTIETYNVHFGVYIFHSKDIWYSQFCFHSESLFGCSGLRNKKYCIFNKQYSREEYEKLVPKIIEYMQKTGEWGKFFPPETSPFGYNETVAQEYLPLTKEKAVAKNYKWKDPDFREYADQTFKIAEEIKDVSDSIVDELLACNECGKNYKIIAQELRRLKDLNLPLPEKCPDCRCKKRMMLRNHRKIWDSKCDKCSAPIQTTYSPQRKEKVYCESCYLKEVY